ncbi:MAG: hypothetical protein PVJ09_05340 [Candidatus Woesebacteria bacterium]|jgi:tagatose-1,6-bisphosphate aldolase
MKLPSIQTEKQAYALVEFDYSPALAEKLGLDLSIADNLKFLDQVNQSLVSELSAQASGVVLDPVYTFPLINKKSDNCGLIFRLEKLETEVDPVAVASLIPDWGVELIRNNYALAKLELFYHPAEENALLKKQLVAELYDYCQYEKIDFFLKLIIYTPADEDFDQLKFQEAQLESLKEFRDMADLLALQFPYDALSCATITAELDSSWILILEAEDYEIAKQNLRIALENGAEGFLAQDILWSEIANLRREDMSPDIDAIQNFIKTTARDRLIELLRISEEIAGEKKD